MNIFDKLSFTVNKSLHYMNELINLNHGVKLLGIASLWLASQLFDPGLYKEVIISIIALPTIDYLTGIIGAHKKGEKVQSRGFYGSIVKVATYALVLGACRLSEYPVPELSVLDNIAIKAIAVTEIWSIVENFDKMGYVKNKKLKELIRGISK